MRPSAIAGIAAGLVAAGIGINAATGAAPQAPASHVTAHSTADGYTRDQFGSGWADLDHDGCETRDEILARDLTNVHTDDGCDVKAGTLHDPYTGRTIDFTDAAYWTVDIDHVYPLHAAWEGGADQWTRAKRIAFANDPRNLLAVDAHSNRSKGDQGPGEWVPINKGFACGYGALYARVALDYQLPVTGPDLDALDHLLATCKETR